ncbi:MAG: FAD binding domain-containing protein [Chloroflexi bacterium]|nr:FAD binding domain-containing protein [Chloroflexota bacterium]
MWKTYHNVASADEAVDLLAQYGPRARVVAGATDLLIELERGTRPHLEALVDVSRVAELVGIEETADSLILGAMATHNDVVASDPIRRFALPLAQASWEVGAPQIRNRATIAGNVITASPANDTICPLMALDASVELRSVRGTRTIRLAEFYTGLRKTVMEPDELLVNIRVPKMTASQRGIFLKLGLRRAQAISVVNCTVLLTLDAASIVTDAVITLGSVAPVIIRVPDAELQLIGQPLTPEVMSRAARAAAAAPSPIDDVRSTAAYRREMIGVLVHRALRMLAQDASVAPPSDAAMLWGAEPHPVIQRASTLADGDRIEVEINGVPRRFDRGHDCTLLDFLREAADLPGTKEGCAEGECGACTVLLDGAAVMACMVPAVRAHGARVTTVEGLKVGDQLHPVQAGFIAEGAVQCGYCTPGFLVAGAALLHEHTEPTRAQIEQAFSGNLCRCTGYYKIISAMQSASQSHGVTEATDVSAD